MLRSHSRFSPQEDQQRLGVDRRPQQPDMITECQERIAGPSAQPDEIRTFEYGLEDGCGQQTDDSWGQQNDEPWGPQGDDAWSQQAAPPMNDFIMLNNDVHPLFSRINFPGADYDALLPALRLASLLIDTDCLLDFWHALWFGEFRQVSDSEDSGLALFRPRPVLSAKDRAMTRLNLLCLSKDVKFYRSTQLGICGGMCCTEPGEAIAGSSALQQGPRLVNEQIWYAESLYQELLETPSHINFMDDNDLRRHFRFAALMVHECCHAAASAAFLPSFDCVFEHNTMAEDGYDWENHVFGGVVRHFDDKDAIIPWPNATIANDYTHNKLPIKITGDYSDVDMYWWIPESYVEKLFNMRFWTESVPNEGAEALKVPREEGARVKVEKDGSCSYFRPSDESADRYDGLPEGTYEDDFDVIRPLDPAVREDVEGFGRLMRINVEALQRDSRAGSVCPGGDHETNDAYCLRKDTVYW